MGQVARREQDQLRSAVRGRPGPLALATTSSLPRLQLISSNSTRNVRTGLTDQNSRSSQTGHEVTALLEDEKDGSGMGKRANIRATAVNTKAIAESNAEIAKQARRDQLAAQGLIDFNVTDGVVRAVERRLATERGETVPPIGDPTGSYGAAALGAVMFIVGLILAFAGVGAASFWLLLLGVFVTGGAMSNANKIEQLRNDENELEAFEAARAQRRHDIVASAQPPRPTPPAGPAPAAPSAIAPQAPIESPASHTPVHSSPALTVPAVTSPRRHQRGMRRPAGHTHTNE